MKNKGLFIALAVVVIVGAAAFALTSSNPPSPTVAKPAATTKPDTTSAVATTSINIQDFSFTPTPIKAKIGDTVTWINHDSASHTVTADTTSADMPDSPTLDKDQTYSFTFKKAGTYTYSCTFHPQMRAKVIVE